MIRRQWARDLRHELTRTQLIDWLVQWRQEMKGSISPTNHRKLLATRSTRDLERMYQQIQSQQWDQREVEEAQRLAEEEWWAINDATLDELEDPK